MKKDKHTWNLTPLYKSDNDPQIEKDVQKAMKKNHSFINKWKNRQDYLNDPKVLREALDEYNQICEIGPVGPAIYYLQLRNSQDQTDKKIIARSRKVNELAIETANNLEFFELNICKIPISKQKFFLESKYLEPYKHFLELAFLYAKFLLSEKEEQFLQTYSPLSYENWIEMLSQFLSKETITIVNEDGEKETIPFSNRFRYITSQNEKTRESASKETIRVLEKWSDVAEHELNSILQNKKNGDKLRGHSRPDEAGLIGNDTSIEVVDQMLSSVESHFDLSRKYYKLKAQLMGKEKIAYFERTLPYKESKDEYPYNKAVEIVKDTLNDLDPEFKKIYEEMEKNGRYDVYPKRGKDDGAFCTHSSKSLPIYVLLNHNNTFNSVLTMAHETGHAINHYLINQNELELNVSCSLSIAEVASTFFEGFVCDKIAEEADKETRFSILVNQIQEDIGSIHRQVACYRFEQELHENFRKEGFLPKEDISKIFKKHMVGYMGDYVEQEKGTEYFWVIWSHIRRYFYVYSYASGLLISKALQRMVKEDPKNIEKVKVMLSTGSSKSPEQIFKDIGIDITKQEFWEEGLKEIEDTYDEIYSLAKELGKI